jgi:predicted nuclease of predicted toxin-antitoxin system
MRLLFDENLSFRLCDLLADLFPNSLHVRDAGLASAPDQMVWRYARDHEFVLVTLDVDFAELAALLGPPPKVIWLRTGNQPARHTAEQLRTHVAAIQAFEAEPEAACLEIY